MLIVRRAEIRCSLWRILVIFGKKFNHEVHHHPISFYRASTVMCVENLNLGSVAIEALFHDSGGIIGAHIPGRRRCFCRFGRVWMLFENATEMQFICHRKCNFYVFRMLISFGF